MNLGTISMVLTCIGSVISLVGGLVGKKNQEVMIEREIDKRLEKKEESK